MVENSSAKVETFNEIFLDEKNRGSWLLIAFLLICNSLCERCGTLSLTSGGVKVKIPNLGMLTPRPMRRLRLT